MKRALFMTVGTGVGVDEDRVKKLAHGLLTSIELYNPDMVVFFGSGDSEKTVESLKMQYKERKSAELMNYEFVRLDDVDDFYECYTKIEREIKDKGDYEIIVDYTSGTKTMTTSAAICAMLYQKRLSLVSGKRGRDGIVIPGTEAPREQNLFAAYDKYLLDRVKEAFNSYRFNEAKSYLRQIVALEERDRYDKLVQAYDLWDKFEHAGAYELLIGVKEERTKSNKGFLGRLIKGREDYILIDLMNNAKRRIEEGKYDDAVARLYRAMELIAQYVLRSKYDIDTGNVDTWTLKASGRLEPKTVEKYEKLRDEEGKIRLTLKRDYELLRDLGEEIGEKFSGDTRMRDLLRKRNESILAHGSVPVRRDDAERMYEIVTAYVKQVVDDMESLMEKSKFPKL